MSPIHLEEQVQLKITKMLKDGIIQNSKSPWESRIVIQPKGEDDIRICNNFKQLNARLLEMSIH